MIKYRPVRGGLREAMSMSQTFDTIEDMLRFIVDESGALISLDDLIVSTPQCNDPRIAWKESRLILTKRYGETMYEYPQVIGYCSIE
jgi:hypothetical protein